MDAASWLEGNELRKVLPSATSSLAPRCPMPHATDEHLAVGHSTQLSVNGHPSWGWLNVEDALPVLFMSSFLKSKCSYRDPVDGALPPRLEEMEFKQIHCYCDF